MELVMEWVETFEAVDMWWMYFDFKKEINFGGQGQRAEYYALNYILPKFIG